MGCDARVGRRESRQAWGGAVMDRLELAREVGREVAISISASTPTTAVEMAMRAGRLDVLAAAYRMNGRNDWAAILEQKAAEWAAAARAKGA